MADALITVTWNPRTDLSKNSYTMLAGSVTLAELATEYCTVLNKKDRFKMVHCKMKLHTLKTE